MNALQLIELLGSDSSKKFKTSTLLQHKDNQVFKKLFEYGYNPMINFYIRKIPVVFHPVEQSGSEATLNWALDELYTVIAARVKTGNEAVEHLRWILSSLSEDDARVIELVIKRNFYCGVSEATINEVWPGLIPSYPCMLCESNKEKNRKVIQFPVFVQTKSDGLRVNAHVDDDQVMYYTRSGQILDINTPDLDGEFINLGGGYGCPVVFDGELLFSSDSIDRKTSNGIGTKAIRGTISDQERDLANVYVWDAIPLDKFKTDGKYNTPYVDRFNTLSGIVDLYKPKRINLIDTWVVDSWEMVEDIYSEHREKGLEGVIVKNAYSIWEDRRTKNQIKMKAENTADVLVTGYTIGTEGKFKGMIASLECQTGGAYPIVFSLGSGFTEEERKKDPSTYVGNIIEIKYNEIIKSKGDKPRSFFLPIFSTLRADKSAPDLL